MTLTESSVLIVVVLAALAVVVVVRNRARTGVDLNAGKFRLKASGSNDPAPAAVIKGAVSASGGAFAEDETGLRGALIEDTKVDGDLRAINRNPEEQAPKT